MIAALVPLVSPWPSAARPRPDANARAHRPGGRARDLPGDDPHRPRPGAGPALGRQLPEVRPRPPLRRHDLPPRHARLHGPGRRLDPRHEGEAHAPARPERGEERPPQLPGTVAMARTTDPNSATSQFFINVRDNHRLDFGIGGAGYAVFGEVDRGHGRGGQDRGRPHHQQRGHAGRPRHADLHQDRARRRAPSERPRAAPAREPARARRPALNPAPHRLAASAAAPRCPRRRRRAPWVAPQADQARVNPVSPSKDALKRGRTLFLKNCATCHGQAGRATGPPPPLAWSPRGTLPRPPCRPGSATGRCSGRSRRAGRSAAMS